MPHDHHHHHLPVDAGGKRLWIATGINIGLTLAQIVAGLISGSLALIADAIHNLSDAISLVLALVARRIARRPADAEMTFGYGRAEVVAALINYTTLIVLSVWLAAEGVMRMLDPQPIAGWVVVIVATLALIVDAVTAWLTFRMARDSMNIRAAFLHNLADALGSIGVIFAGTLVLLYDWRLIDPIVTLLIAAYILWHAASEVMPAIRILMLGSPGTPHAEEVLEAMRAMPGVEDVHHLHLWRMQEHETALEAHVVQCGPRSDAVRQSLKAMLIDRFAIHHSTIEVEPPEAACEGIPAIGH
ncbi:cation efflux system protein [Pseudooceanicola batsensis HTCC2597]|uniref:Cation efflux system protein n=1 Tax=Pseudooceanicola batsensis (strain ATCC BAA-863 / DSM 15984 / KCTC 12145 / HTCC2597) TaxID=252305 RepID=A3TW24_PSEBH|nr:cation diffusion facilitator family transporter [Pseudooceanicola batsensis]EAQ03820.1 cation efflux system protein [Pseudooceanicola batsensis HTCC2597]